MITIVYGTPDDGYLTSTNSNYTTARNGSGVVLTGGGTLWCGQNYGSGVYQHHQAFIGFTFPAVPAGEVVVAAMFRLTMLTALSPAVARNLEIRGYTWSTGAGFGSGDWRNPTQLASAQLRGQVNSIHQVVAGEDVYAGSDELVTAVASTTSQELVVVTSRQRAGNVPTGDEGVAFQSADASGTDSDPALVIVTAPRSTLFGVLGAQTRMSDGRYVHLVSDGAASPTITLRVEGEGTLGTLSIGSGVDQFAVPRGLQSFALARGADDTVFVIGPSGVAEGSIRVETWVPSGGTWDLVGGQTVPLPAHDAAINQVAACVVESDGLESLVVVVAHTAGEGTPVTVRGDLAYVILDTVALRAGTSASRGQGVAPGNLVPVGDSPEFCSPYNEVGTGLDLVADPDSPGYLYCVSYGLEQLPGVNYPQAITRARLHTSHTGITESVSLTNEIWCRKDPTGKIRVVPIGANTVAVVATDADTGYGLAIHVYTYPSPGNEPVLLGYTTLASESIPSMPDGPDVAESHAWDALHSVSDGALWVYYVDVDDPTRLLRTSYDLASYQATRVERLVWTAPAGSAITGVRVARDARAGDRTLVTVAYTGPGDTLAVEYVWDSYNVPPTAPTLLPRDGADADYPITLQWVFNDANEGDAQSARHVQVENVGTASLAVDTGKEASTATSYTIPGGTLDNNASYRWRVRVWDSEDEESPWSEWGMFATAPGGAVTITLPAVDNAPGIATDEIEIRWEVTGTTQVAYRVWLYRTSPESLVFDTGWVTSTETSHTLSGLVSDREYRVEVQVRNALNVPSNIGTRLITPSYGTPERPEVTVTPVPDGGYVQLSIRNPLPGEPEASGPLWDYEDGEMPGWTVEGGTATVVSDGPARSGEYALRLVSGGGLAVATAPAVTVTADQRYTARGWVYHPDGGAVNMVLYWWGADGEDLGGVMYGTEVPVATWAEVRVNGTAPEGAAFVTYGPAVSGGAEVYVDDVILTGASDRPDVVTNMVLRRPVGDTGPYTVLGSCPPDGVFRDYTAASGVPYVYVVRGVS